MSNGVDKNQLAAVLQVLKKYNLKVRPITVKTSHSKCFFFLKNFRTLKNS